MVLVRMRFHILYAYSEACDSVVLCCVISYCVVLYRIVLYCTVLSIIIVLDAPLNTSYLLLLLLPFEPTIVNMFCCWVKFFGIKTLKKEVHKNSLCAFRIHFKVGGCHVIWATENEHGATPQPPPPPTNTQQQKQTANSSAKLSYFCKWSWLLTEAPLSIRSLHTPTWSDWAASIRGVLPYCKNKRRTECKGYQREQNANNLD